MRICSHQCWPFLYYIYIYYEIVQISQNSVTEKCKSKSKKEKIITNIDNIKITSISAESIVTETSSTLMRLFILRTLGLS